MANEIWASDHGQTLRRLAPTVRTMTRAMLVVATVVAVAGAAERTCANQECAACDSLVFPYDDAENKFTVANAIAGDKPFAVREGCDTLEQLCLFVRAPRPPLVSPPRRAPRRASGRSAGPRRQPTRYGR